MDPGDLSVLIDAEGTRVAAPSNRPLHFTSEHLWYVRRGRVDVFATARSSHAAGARTHLLRVEAGKYLFGAPGAEERPFALVGVGGPDTELVMLERARLLAWAREPALAPIAVEAVNGWVQALCWSMMRGAVPKQCRELECGTPIPLPAKTLARPQRCVAWVTHMEGHSLLLGRPELDFNGAGYFPISRRAWLKVEGGGTLYLTDTASLFGNDALWDGLARLHTAVLAWVAATTATAMSGERERLRRQGVERGRVLADALAALASSLGPREEALPTVAAPDEAPNEIDALRRVCTLVGRALHIQVVAPPAGSSLASRDPLDAIAKASGFRTRRVILREEWWREDGGPLVGALEATARPVALLYTTTGYVLHDPTARARRRVTAEVAATLAPQAWTFYRPFPAEQLSIRDVLRFGLFGCARDVLLVVVLGIVGGVLATIPPIATGMLLDAVIPSADRSQLLQLTLILFALSVGAALFQLTRSLAMVRIQGKVTSAIQAAVWDRLLRLPLSFFRPFTAGDLAVRAMGIDAIRQVLTGTVISAIFGGVFSVFNIGVMFYYSTELAWRGLGLIACAALATVAVSVLQLKRQRRTSTLRSRTSGVVLQLLGSIAKLRVAAAEVQAFARWAQLFSEQRRLQFGTRTIQVWYSVFTALLPVVASLVLFATAVPMLGAEARTLTAGQFIAFLGAFAAVLGAVLGTGGGIIAVLVVVPLYENASPIFQTLPEVGAHKMDPGALSGEIEVQQLRFRYAADAPLTLRDISLQIKAGEFVAFVGPSGSGKSTLLRLLLGFETPESGAIYFDGHDLAGLDIERVRKQIGVVLQSGRLMPGDLFTNIVGSSSAALNDAWEAARMAGLDADIEQMPMGMHTVVSEGAGTLSGGQRQRLMIARAVVARPRLLFFDEATSALDNRTQAIVSASLARLQATRIVVAHRLSTVVDADRICVLQAGRIVETGTYQQLLDQRGVFAELARRQLV